MRYRLIDTADAELGIIEDDRAKIAEDEIVQTPDGTLRAVLEVYDDDEGRDGDVAATLVVDVD
jgi:hypothetical protein